MTTSAEVSALRKTKSRPCQSNTHIEGSPGWVVEGDNLQALSKLPDNKFRLVYIDPPFNTGRTRKKTTLRTTRTGDDGGDRTGFGGKRYRTVASETVAYEDSIENYLDFLKPRLEHARRVLTEDGTLYFHIDYRESHYCKVLLDTIFGRDCFINEIVWAYDYGGRSKRRWPAKHDTVFMYAKHPTAWYFDGAAAERIPFAAPGVSPSDRDKHISDVWWHTIVGTNSREKTGYPTQKPEGLLRNIVSVSAGDNDWVLDFFAGSGTIGAVAQQLGRRFVLVDNNPEAIRTIRNRLGTEQVRYANTDAFCGCSPLNYRH